MREFPFPLFPVSRTFWATGIPVREFSHSRPKMIESKGLKNRWYKPNIKLFTQNASSQSVAIVYNELEWSMVNILGAIYSVQYRGTLIDLSHSNRRYTFQYPNLKCPFDLGMIEKIATCPIDWLFSKSNILNLVFSNHSWTQMEQISSNVLLCSDQITSVDPS